MAFSILGNRSNGSIHKSPEGSDRGALYERTTPVPCALYNQVNCTERMQIAFENLSFITPKIVVVFWKIVGAIRRAFPLPCET